MGLLEIFAAFTKKSFKDSLEDLEADIYKANTLASECPSDGAFLQIRICYSPAATLFLFLVQWMDCSLAGAIGLLRILIYKVYFDGTTTMSTHEKKASIKQFYAFIFPTLKQLRKEATRMEDEGQRTMFLERFRRRSDSDWMSFSVVGSETEDECGICMMPNCKFVLPSCNHCLCLNCFNDWKARAQECPFCRSSVLEVAPDELWVFIERRDTLDSAAVTAEDLRRFSLYFDNLSLFS